MFLEGPIQPRMWLSIQQELLEAHPFTTGRLRQQLWVPSLTDTMDPITIHLLSTLLNQAIRDMKRRSSLIIEIHIRHHPLRFILHPVPYGITHLPPLLRFPHSLQTPQVLLLTTFSPLHHRWTPTFCLSRMKLLQHIRPFSRTLTLTHQLCSKMQWSNVCNIIVQIMFTWLWNPDYSSG